jgi:hypothetical protein
MSVCVCVSANRVDILIAVMVCPVSTSIAFCRIADGYLITQRRYHHNHQYNTRRQFSGKSHQVSYNFLPYIFPARHVIEWYVEADVWRHLPRITRTNVKRKPSYLNRIQQFTYPRQNTIVTYTIDIINERTLARTWPITHLRIVQHLKAGQLVGS